MALLQPLEIKDKAYYKNEYDKFWNKCLRLSEAHLMAADKPLNDGFDNCETRAFAAKYFEQYATAEQLVGYYLTCYPQRAYKAWRENPIKANEESDGLAGEILCEMFPLNKKLYY